MNVLFPLFLVFVCGLIVEMASFACAVSSFFFPLPVPLSELTSARVIFGAGGGENHSRAHTPSSQPCVCCPFGALFFFFLARMDSLRPVAFRGGSGITVVDQSAAHDDDASHSDSSSSWTFTGVQASDNEDEGSMSLQSPSVSRTVQIVLGDGSGSSGGSGATSSRPCDASSLARSDLERKKEGFVLRASSSSIVQQYRPHRNNGSNAVRLVAQHYRKDDNRFQLAGASSSAASPVVTSSSHVYGDDDDVSSTSSTSTESADVTVKQRREDRLRAPFESLNLDSDAMSKSAIHGARLLRFGLLQAPRGMHVCVRCSKTGDEQLWLWIDGITRPSHSSRGFAVSYLLHHPEIMNHSATVNVAFPFFAARSFGTTIAQWDEEHFVLSGAFLTCNDNALAGAFELRLKSVAPTPLASAEKGNASSTSANAKKSKKRKFSILSTAAPSSAAANSIMAGTLRLSNKRQSINVFIRSWDDIAPTWQQVPFLYGDATILPGAKIRYDGRLWTFVAWHKPQSNCVVIRYGDREAKKDVVFCRKIVRLYTQPLDLDSSSSTSSTSSSYGDDDYEVDEERHAAADDHRTNDTDSVYLSTLSNDESSSNHSLSMSDDDSDGDGNAERATQQLIPSQSTSSSMRRAAANAAPYRPSQQ